MKLMDVVREIALEEKKYFQNYTEYARQIKEIAESILGDADVYVFGSVVEGKHTPASDIDILIVSENAPKSQWERAKIRAKIVKAIDVFAPFEIHIVALREFEWYKRLVSVMRKI